jgi:osmotically-inducible protein OsmY
MITLPSATAHSLTYGAIAEAHHWPNTRSTAPSASLPTCPSNLPFCGWPALLACVLVLGWLAGPPAAAADEKIDRGPYPGGKVLGDSSITTAVENALLQEDDEFPNDVDVATQKGIVTLTGSVSKLLAKKRAVTIAESIRGVRSVIDMLTVSTVSRPDEDIRKDILSALLQDPATDSYTVQVAVAHAVVILTGMVGSFEDKQLAERIAEGVRGVAEIHNSIAVMQSGQRTTADISGDIRDRIQWDVWLNGDQISVSVQDGRVLLSGTVGSARDIWRAFCDGWVPGVVSVDVSGVKVDPNERDASRRSLKFAIKSNGEIKQAVAAAMKIDPRTKGYVIDITADDGEIFLRGNVGNLKAKHSAEQDAMSTVGVSSVENLIKVRPKENLSDAAIAASLKSTLFADARLGDYSIAISVVNHVAFLTGTVDSRLQKDEAQDAAARTKGVTMIINHLKVEPEFSLSYGQYQNYNPAPYVITEIYDATPFLSDDRIRMNIDNGLSWCPDLGWGQITVTVTSGVATLSGTVRKWIARSEADTVAHHSGASTIINHIDVEQGAWWWP